ncbi:hypothetical protein GCM10020331_015910 [Ectobacillus funiculus]
MQQAGADWIILAGYMRLIGETLLSAYSGHIVNIHPSLLPSFPGKDAIGQALAAGVEETGVTVHYVDEGMDTGPIIAQQAVKVENDTYESLQKEDPSCRTYFVCADNPRFSTDRSEIIMATKRALVSVSNKEGIVEFVQGLIEQGVEVISTGGTKKLLQEKKA